MPAPDTLPSPIHSPSTSLHSLATCSDESENETLADSMSSLPNPLDKGVDELVQHMVDGAQRVADVDELSEAALKSFELIAQWSAETPVCDDPAIVNGARSAGRDYIKIIKESVAVAGQGVAFAAEVIYFCDLLSKPEGLGDAGKSFVDGMRTIVQKALSEAETINLEFRHIRAKLLQLIKKIPVQQNHINEKRANPKDHSKEQDHIGALELLQNAYDNIAQLTVGVDKFTNWWRQAQQLITTLETRTFVSYPRIDSIRLDMAKKGWESVSDRYEAYTRAMDTLADCYPVHVTHTFASMLVKAMAWFTKASPDE